MKLKRKRSFSEGEVNSKTEVFSKRVFGDTESLNEHKEVQEDEADKLWVQDFNWAEQGSFLISKYYSDISPLLDDKFQAASRIVLGGEEEREKETLFRRAVWNYVQVT